MMTSPRAHALTASGNHLLVIWIVGFIIAIGLTMLRIFHPAATGGPDLLAFLALAYTPVATMLAAARKRFGTAGPETGPGVGPTLYSLVVGTSLAYQVVVIVIVVRGVYLWQLAPPPLALAVLAAIQSVVLGCVAFVFPDVAVRQHGGEEGS